MKFVCIALIGLLLVGTALASQAQCEAGLLDPGYFVHDVYCNKFFTCSLTMWIEHTCKEGQMWDQEYQGCNYEHLVDCGSLVRERK